MKKITISANNIRLITLLIATSLLSGWIGFSLRPAYQEKSVSFMESISIDKLNANPKSDIDLSLFWKVWHKLESDYVDKDKIDNQKMVYGAIAGMTSSLGDPYTVFLPPVQNKKAKESLQGSFEGIGAQLGTKDGRIIVVAPIKGSPSEQAGIKAGDWIVKVNGESTESLALPDVVDKIRGPKGEKVVLTVFHEEATESEDIEVIRDTIKVASVEVDFKDNVAYLRLSQFGDTSNSEWDKAVDSIVKTCGTSGTSTCRGVVFDLRNNPGGYLQGAVYIASEFLKDGLVVAQQHSSGRKEEYFVNRKGRLLTIPVIVLINEGSASASEIVSGALKVRGRAELVGKKSFGKGSVQEAIDLENGAGLHITTAKWLLPDDSWIMGKGIEPDHDVSLDKNNPTEDLQFEKAVSLLVE